MGTHLLQVTAPGLAYMVIGGFVVLFSLGSLLLRQKLYVNEIVLGTACGALFGPYGAGIFNPRAWGNVNAITLEVMRITLAAALFTVGVQLPRSYLVKHARGLLVMVVPTMAIGWTMVACAASLAFNRLDFVSSLVVAACLTPTDPIISTAIVGGKYAPKHSPLHLRRIMAAESALNSGLAYLFLSLPIYLTTQKPGVAFGEWTTVGCLYQGLLGTAIGVALGLASSYLLKLSYRAGFINRESYLAQYLALTLFTVGVTKTLGCDDLLAAFAAGSALNWDGRFSPQVKGQVFSAVLSLVLNCGTFVYIGAWMPFNSFNVPELGIAPWRLVLLFLAVLCFRRIPALLILYRWIPEISTWKEALFAGHFGPMGVGAIFISLVALMELPKPQTPPQGQAEILAATLQPIVAFVVLASIFVHGLSATLFSIIGRSVGARTVGLMKSWNLRNASNGTPKWLLWFKRTSTESLRTGSPGTSEEDMERGEGLPTGRTGPNDNQHKEGDRKNDQECRLVVELGPTSMFTVVGPGSDVLTENNVVGGTPTPERPEKIQIRRHADMSALTRTPALASREVFRTSAERSPPPLPVKDSRRSVASLSHVSVLTINTDDQSGRSPDPNPSPRCNPTPTPTLTLTAHTGDRSIRGFALPDDVGEEDQDLADACHLPSSPVSSYGGGLGVAFPTPVDDDTLDLTAFVAQLRGRGARTVSSPSVRIVRFSQEVSEAGSLTSHGHVVADPRA